MPSLHTAIYTDETLPLRGGMALVSGQITNILTKFSNLGFWLILVFFVLKKKMKSLSLSTDFHREKIVLEILMFYQIDQKGRLFVVFFPWVDLKD